jgi:hypothetical protein
MWDKETGAFKAVAFASQAIIKTHVYLWQFWAIDACHTKSQYRMILIICYNINTNGNILPVV